MTSVQATRNVERVVGAGTEDFDRVRERVEQLARIGSELLVVPSRVTMARGDRVAVSEPARNHDTLRTVLDARGALRAGECVWLGTAVAQALAVLHKNGLAHGALDADAVVIERGSVRLSRLIDATGEASAADDVAALGRLLVTAVRDSDGGRIVAWTEPMTHVDPHGRPSAAMVVHALASCAPPEAVLLPPVGIARELRRAAAPGGELQAGGAVPLREARWWRLRMRVSTALKRGGIAILALGLVGGIGMAVAWTTQADPVTAREAARESVAAPVADAPAASPRPSVTTPAEAGERLTLARFDALSRGDGTALIGLTVAGSPARADAEATASALREGLLVVKGLEGTVEESVALVDHTASDPKDGEGAVVRVRYRLGPHVVFADNESTHYEGYEQTVDLALEWVAGSGWLVSDATVSNATVSNATVSQDPTT